MDLPASNDGTPAGRETSLYHGRGRGRWRQSTPLKRVLVLLGSICLAGCQSAPPPPVYPELSFSGAGVIRFNVAAIEVISSYISPGKSPNVEHEFPYSPEELMWQWAEDRLRAVSARGGARMTIRDAAIRRRDLKTGSGLRALFTRHQSERYTADLEAVIVVYDGSRSGSVVIKVSRDRTFPEGLTADERDQARYDFLNQTMEDFNTEAERGITRELGGFLAPDNV